jgi:hypothetical protein
MHDVLPAQARGYFFILLIDQTITRHDVPCEARFVAAGVIVEQSTSGSKTYLSISTQCLLGSNNQMYIVFDRDSNTYALASPFIDEAKPTENLPIKTVVFSNGADPVNDWRRFLEAIEKPVLRDAVTTNEIGNPLEPLVAGAGLFLKVDEHRFPFSRFEGFVIWDDGRLTITVTPSEVALSESNRVSISRLEHVPTDPPGQWSARTFSHYRRGWRARDRIHATGTIIFT